MTMTAYITTPTIFGQGNQGPSDPTAPRDRIARVNMKKPLIFIQHSFDTCHADDFPRKGIAPLTILEYMAA
jgi:hypothetical protein